MQIPELNLFWLLVGAFFAAGATWWLDAMLIKRRMADSDGAALAALHEKARQIEPLSQKLRDAHGQIADLEAKLVEVDTTVHVEELTVKVNDLDKRLAEALNAEEQASQVAQSLKQELANKNGELVAQSASVAQLNQQIEQQQLSSATLRDQANEAVALRQSLADLKQRFEDLQSSAPSETELANLRLRAEHAEGEVDRLGLELEHSAPASQIGELEAQIQSLQGQLEAQSSVANQDFERERDGLLTTISKLQSQLIESDEVVENFRSQLAGANATLADQATEPERIQSLESHLAERRAEVERYERRIPELEGALIQLRDELAVRDAAIAHLSESSEADELRATIASLNRQLESLRHETDESRTQLVQAKAEAELLREAKQSGQVASPPVVASTEVSALEERMNDLFGAVQASHREAAENRRALQTALEQIQVLQQSVGQSTSTPVPEPVPLPKRVTSKTSTRKKVVGGGSVRDELTESSDLGELS